MNKEIKELNSKSNDEICSLITKLKSQLLESRFKMAVGEMQKTHVIRQIKKTIARSMSVLGSRGYDNSIGSHGVYLIDKKTSKVIDITKNINKIAVETTVETAKVKPTKLVKPIAKPVNRPVNNTKPPIDKKPTKIISTAKNMRPQKIQGEK